MRGAAASAQRPTARRGVPPASSAAPLTKYALPPGCDDWVRSDVASAPATHENSGDEHHDRHAPIVMKAMIAPMTMVSIR